MILTVLTPHPKHLNLFMMGLIGWVSHIYDNANLQFQQAMLCDPQPCVWYSSYNFFRLCDFSTTWVSFWSCHYVHPGQSPRTHSHVHGNSTTYQTGKEWSKASCSIKWDSPRDSLCLEELRATWKSLGEEFRVWAHSDSTVLWQCLNTTKLVQLTNSTPIADDNLSSGSILAEKVLATTSTVLINLALGAQSPSKRTVFKL